VPLPLPKCPGHGTNISIPTEFLSVLVSACTSPNKPDKPTSRKPNKLGPISDKLAFSS
jgi:hypothetical protein